MAEEEMAEVSDDMACMGKPMIGAPSLLSLNLDPHYSSPMVPAAPPVELQRQPAFFTNIDNCELENVKDVENEGGFLHSVADVALNDQFCEMEPRPAITSDQILQGVAMGQQIQNFPETQALCELILADRQNVAVMSTTPAMASLHTEPRPEVTQNLISQLSMTTKQLMGKLMESMPLNKPVRPVQHVQPTVIEPPKEVKKPDALEDLKYSLNESDEEDEGVIGKPKLSATTKCIDSMVEFVQQRILETKEPLPPGVPQKDNKDEDEGTGNVEIEKSCKTKSSDKEVDSDREDGELSDDDYPPGSKNRVPFCSLFLKGQCVFGTSCRFIHNHFTKQSGNYKFLADVVEKELVVDKKKEKKVSRWSGYLTPDPESDTEVAQPGLSLWEQAHLEEECPPIQFETRESEPSPNFSFPHSSRDPYEAYEDRRSCSRDRSRSRSWDYEQEMKYREEKSWDDPWQRRRRKSRPESMEAGDNRRQRSRSTSPSERCKHHHKHRHHHHRHRESRKKSKSQEKSTAAASTVKSKMLSAPVSSVVSVVKNNQAPFRGDEPTEDVRTKKLQSMHSTTLSKRLPSAVTVATPVEKKSQEIGVTVVLKSSIFTEKLKSEAKPARTVKIGLPPKSQGKVEFNNLEPVEKFKVKKKINENVETKIPEKIVRVSEKDKAKEHTSASSSSSDTSDESQLSSSDSEDAERMTAEAKAIAKASMKSKLTASIKKSGNKKSFVITGKERRDMKRKMEKKKKNMEAEERNKRKANLLEELRKVEDMIAKKTSYLPSDRI